MITQVPALWDGGFWYVVPISVRDDGFGPYDTVEIPAPGWCAWYDVQNDTALVRTVEAVVLPEQHLSAIVDDKPRARIGGL